MKTIIIGKRTLYYKVDSDCSEDGYTWEWTDFFTLKGKKPELKWSWNALFNFKKPMVPTGKMVDNYVKRFSVSFSVEDRGKTKSEVRKVLEKKVELLGREDEINRGEII